MPGSVIRQYDKHQIFSILIMLKTGIKFFNGIDHQPKQLTFIRFRKFLFYRLVVPNSKLKVTFDVAPVHLK